MDWEAKATEIEGHFSSLDLSEPVMVDGYLKVHDPKKTYTIQLQVLRSGCGDDIKNTSLYHLRKLHKALRKKEPVKFNGSDYDASLDNERLTGQIERVFNCMKSGEWRGLAEIAAITGDGEASISAQLRHLRKERFGGHSIEKKRFGDPSNGFFKYKLTVK
mgnify:CR=1 FL=1